MKASCVGLFLAIVIHGASFDVASVKKSAEQKGVDYRGRVIFSVDRISARNVTFHALIATAYHVQLSQVVGGKFKWLDSDEFDVDARAGGATDPNGLREMLQTLLRERFHLVVATEMKDLRILALVVDAGGAKIKPSTGDPQPGRFHGTMQQFADLLAVQTTIPGAVDPSTPVMASSDPVPVVDKTGLTGEYDINVDLKPELGTDRLTQWRRVLKDELGLRLESQRAKVAVLVVTGAERTPTAN
ncbi:MAG TPA: TIGR03435 family protein [Bryobacteraceae bacterium]|jgi:uncharacterized protein (TIGR03435 family)